MRKIPLALPKLKIAEFCKRYHIAYLALFGSVLTSNFTEHSDLDVLVKFKKKYTPHLFGIIKMEAELSSIVGRAVDLKTPNDLSPYFRDDVLAQAITVYGK